MNDYISSVIQVWQVQGFKVLLHKINKFLFWKEHNTDIIKIIEQFSKDYDVFLDVGSKIGAVTIGVGSHFTKCVCFEPATKNYQQLVSNIKKNDFDNIVPYNIALGNSKGTRTFYLSPTITGDNRFNIQENEKFNSQEVEVNTLDDILESLNISEKCIIKIDVQGFELDVFKGAKKLLNKDCLIISEFWPWGLAINNTDPLEYIKYLQSLGFGFYDMDNNPVEYKYLSRLCLMGKTRRFVQDDFIIKK